jgi:hypothetical protein
MRLLMDPGDESIAKCGLFKIQLGKTLHGYDAIILSK